MIRKEVVRAVVEKDGKFLLLHNIGKNRYRWEFPGGKVEQGESTENAVIRELWEETGVSMATAYLFSSCEIDTDSDHWIVFNYYVPLAYETPVIMEPTKFDGMKWVTAEEARHLEQIPAAVVDVLDTLKKTKARMRGDRQSYYRPNNPVRINCS